MNKLFTKNNTPFVKVRTDQIKNDILTSDSDHIPGMISSMLTRIRKMFGDLAKPLFRQRDLGPIDRPNSEEFFEDARSIQHDIALSYENVKTLRTNMDAEFNTTSSSYDVLEEEISKGEEDIRDISIRNDEEGINNVVIIGNDFSDADWIDPDYQVDSEPCFLDVRKGAISLPVSGESSAQVENSSVSIMRVNKGMEGPYNKGQEPSEFFHEGQFYGRDSKAVPAGGTWSFTIVPISELIPRDQQQLHEEFSEGTTAKDNPSFIDNVLNGTVITDGKELIDYPKFFARIKQPSEASLNKMRNAVLDGNPGTFWQCEWVFSPGNSGIDEHFESDFFEVQLMIDLGEHIDTNSITIDPVVFSPAERLEVSAIATSASQDEVPLPLDYNGAGIYSDQLTDTTGRVTSEVGGTQVISPNATGPNWGITYTFAKRRIRYIHLTLLQRTAYRTPYDTAYVKMSRTAKATVAQEEA